MSSAAGTVASGLVADRLSNRRLLTLLSLITLAAPLMLLARHPAAAYSAFAVLGLAMGATGVVNGSIWARTYGTAQLGRIQGTAQSSMITAAAAAPLVPALSHGLTGSYATGLLALAGFAAVASVVAARWRLVT